MSLLIALIVGIAVGVAAGIFLKENIDHLVLNVLFGIAGSILGLVVYVLVLRQADTTSSLFDPVSMLTSVIGALILVLGFNGLHKLLPGRANPLEESGEDLEN